MPCTKCKDGKYKWGNTGECKYATKEECDKANPKKYSKMNPTPLGKKTYEEYAKELKEFNLSKVEKVELANYDFKGYMKEYDKSFSNYRTDFRKGINAAKGVADKHFSDVIKIREKAENEMDEFGTKAKELGIDYRKTKQWGEFQDLKKILLSRESSIKEKLKEISKLQ